MSHDRRHPPLRDSWGIALVALAALAGAPASASDAGAAGPRWAKPGVGGDVAPPARLVVPTGTGIETFVVDAPGAKRSHASRDNADRADRSGRIPAATPGYHLTSTVVIKAEDIAPLRGDLNAAGVTVAPVDGLSGYWRAEAPTVRAAAALAAALRGRAGVVEAHVDTGVPMPLRDPPPLDPGYALQWHLTNAVAPGVDLRVLPAWTSGFTGGGLTVGVVEDGWTETHPDLVANYHAEASMSGSAATSHGTSVAGLIAAGANGQGGVGVAYAGRVSKIYRGTTAIDHQTAFLYRNDLNFIKTNSWGPFDTGNAWTIPQIERDALAQAATTGRNGLGTVFIWAAGNGGTGDRCDYDPYVSSRYVIGVGSHDDTGARAYYNETGSSMFVCAPSSSSGLHLGIYTTTGSNGYTSAFGGTSASAPEAAGVVALMLQANPSLTWRDVQHILARTAWKNDPTNPGWITNAGGRHVSYDYGFGGVDAGAAVAAAVSWRPVAPETVFNSGVRAVGGAIPNNTPAGLTQSVVVGPNLRVETVEVVLNVAHTNIGDLRIVLTAPSGTTSVLALPRLDSTDNYSDYIFKTVRCWDEHSAGTWTLAVSDEAAGAAGTWDSWQLRVYGTPACAADWDGSGGIEPSDVAAYIGAWYNDLINGTTASNFDADPAITPSDVSAFIGAWFAALTGGC